MQSDTHIVGAAALQSGVLLAMNVQDPDLMVGSLVVASAGALLPDFDHAGSRISNRSPALGLIGRLFKHRGFSHTLFFWMLLSIGLYAGYWWGVGKSWWPEHPLANPGIVVFVLGGLSHLFLDSLTPTGVPWFGPFSWSRLSLNICKTGSLLEWLLKIVFVGVNVACLGTLRGYTIQDLMRFLGQG